MATTYTIYNQISNATLSPLSTTGTYTGTISPKTGFVTPICVTVQQLVTYPSIDSLYNTSWVFDTIATADQSYTMTFNFTCGGYGYKKFVVDRGADTLTIQYYVTDDYFTTVYTNTNGWFNEQYKFISVGTGADTAVSDYIEWFKLNAKLKKFYTTIQVINNTITLTDISSDTVIEGTSSALMSYDITTLSNWEDWYSNDTLSTVGQHKINLISQGLYYLDSEKSSPVYFNIYPVTYSSLTGCQGVSNPTKTMEQIQLQTKFTANDGYTFINSEFSNAVVKINDSVYNPSTSSGDSWEISEDYKSVTLTLNQNSVINKINIDITAFDARIPLNATSNLVVYNSILYWNQVAVPTEIDNYEFLIDDTISIDYQSTEASQTGNTLTVTQASTKLMDNTLELN